MRQPCPEHGKLYCGSCRTRPQTPESVTVDDIDTQFTALFAPEDSQPAPEDDVVLVHACNLGGLAPCQCKKEITYAEAKAKVQRGEAEWQTRFSATGAPYQVHSAIVLIVGKEKLTSDASPRGSFFIELNADIQLQLRRGSIREIPDRIPLSRNEDGRPVARRDEFERALAWPEFSDVLDDDELAVWLDAVEFTKPDDLVELAALFSVSLSELNHEFESANAKITARYNECKVTKRGIFANWKNLPKEFRDLPIAKIEEVLAGWSAAIATDEFKRLKPEEQEAIAAWIQARQNYHDASITSGIPQTTLQRRVKSGTAALRDIASETAPKSTAFAVISANLFSRSAVQDALDRDSNPNGRTTVGGRRIPSHKALAALEQDGFAK